MVRWVWKWVASCSPVSHLTAATGCPLGAPTLGGLTWQTTISATAISTKMPRTLKGSAKLDSPGPRLGGGRRRLVLEAVPEGRGRFFVLDGAMWYSDKIQLPFLVPFAPDLCRPVAGPNPQEGSSP